MAETFQQMKPDMVARLEALGPNDRLVIGLTKACKVYIVVFVGVPRLLITLTLLWLGSRWLVATLGFEDILVNAVALEFILLLKDLMYRTMVPNRNKNDVQCTQIIPAGHTQKASYMRFLGTFVWFLVAVLWACLYTYQFQVVLPDYKWDVQGVCTQWVEQHYNVGL
mmetsp:Transcript_44400/g.114843  ORF Transcript_44400/g.114843 Transcript_44400/m.114843 type:complete len:167 (-) Transcript_44400:279-779(-)